MANSYRHRSGDRKEGRLLRSLPALNKFIPYLLRDRDGSSILYEEDLTFPQQTNACVRNA